MLASGHGAGARADQGGESNRRNEKRLGERV
jgi:hypothetical protein